MASDIQAIVAIYPKTCWYFICIYTKPTHSSTHTHTHEHEHWLRKSWKCQTPACKSHIHTFEKWESIVGNPTKEAEIPSILVDAIYFSCIFNEMLLIPFGWHMINRWLVCNIFILVWDRLKKGGISSFQHARRRQWACIQKMNVQALEEKAMGFW